MPHLPYFGNNKNFLKSLKKSLPSFIEPYLQAKTREKVTSHSWEKDITDGRTDGQKRTHGQILWSNKRKSKWCTHFNYFSFYPYQSIKVDISEGIKFTNGPAVSEIKHCEIHWHYLGLNETGMGHYEVLSARSRIN